MALDTTYRPLNYQDVLGQDAAVEVLRQLVREGRGYRQSYVFCGQHGSGKTTLGRILARALLCKDPQDGNPCDKCSSCTAMLKDGVSHETFEELDAASKSKAEDLERIVNDIDYDTFSGQRRIYLFDESHQLSKKALDIMLKPMEDCVEGTENKKLICIFCTTEPQKMRSTIFSRCAPAFVIRAVSPENIAERLAFVCDQEKIPYDQEALITIAEISESHIRDALMSVEGVSMLGAVTLDNVSRYLQLGANALALDILENLGSNLSQAVATAAEMSKEVSPSSAYERLAEAAMCAYRTHLGVGRIPAHWNKVRIQGLASMGEALLGIAARFANPPHRPNRHTLMLDVGTVHHGMTSGLSAHHLSKVVVGVQPANQPANQPASPAVSVAPQETSQAPEVPTEGTASVEATQSQGTVPKHEKTQGRTTDGVWLDPRGIGTGAAASGEPEEQHEPVSVVPATRGALAPHVFRELFAHYLQGLSSGGPAS